MHVLTAVVAATVTMLLSIHTGHLIVRGLSHSERNVRFGMTLLLVTVTLGFVQRASAHDPYLWTHWLVLAALLFCAYNYGRLIAGHASVQRG